MAENELKKEGVPDKTRRKASLEHTPITQKKLNKVPTVKRAKLLPKNESKHKHLTLAREGSNAELEDKKWGETKIFILPLMPTDEDEKKYSSGEYRCAYCHELCDQSNLECKVCSKIAHISCLYRRGYLETEFVPQRTDWSCADCSDLTKCLADDEMRRIINVFDQLDFRKNCFVKLDDYLRVKRNIYEEEGGLMTPEMEAEEKHRFHLMDLDKTGSITWNEFVDFETANLLSKKNKVELSNHLSKKELIVAKRKFLSYDKEKMKMITKEDAKTCYMEYIKKIKDKLGAPMEEHISNCAELFGFRQDPESQKSTAKTMWPEFVRKITLLLLYDRLNSQNFRPRYWKPGNWFLQANDLQSDSPKKDQEGNHRPNGSRHSSSRTQKNSLFMDESDTNKKDTIDKNSLLEISTLMANNLDINNFKPYDYSEFGSFNYVIRSRNYQGKPNDDDQDENRLKMKPNKLNPIQRNKPENDQQLNSTSFNINSKEGKKLIKQDRNHPNQSIEDLLQNNLTGSNLKLGKIPGYVQVSGSTENLNNIGDNTNRTTDFDYSKVTDDIYKAFGKQKQSKYSYPQKITVLKTSRSNKPQAESNHEEYYLNDLVENTKSMLGSKSDFFGQNQRSMIVEKGVNSANPNSKYRDGSTRLVPLESSRIDSRSINGGANSNMSSATNFSQARNNKLMKILGEF